MYLLERYNGAMLTVKSGVVLPFLFSRRVSLGLVATQEAGHVDTRNNACSHAPAQLRHQPQFPSRLSIPKAAVQHRRRTELQITLVRAPVNLINEFKLLYGKTAQRKQNC
jgi:hypothetical protein